jgi:hypothetical protein
VESVDKTRVRWRGTKTLVLGSVTGKQLSVSKDGRFYAYQLDEDTAVKWKAVKQAFLNIFRQ